jgi:Ca2+/Na+ antiporter
MIVSLAILLIALLFSADDAPPMIAAILVIAFFMWDARNGLRLTTASKVSLCILFLSFVALANLAGPHS